MTLAVGTQLGSYEILGPLGAGGMGEVYRARDTKLSREVAIKVLPSELSADAHRLERFEKEARTASALNHPNIVTIYEVGRADTTSFIAMELVAGKTLREMLIVGPLPLKRLLALAAQVADGLAKAHAAGIVHRDLKPENLMVTKDGFVKILDFGLAKLVPGSVEGSGGTNLPTMTRGTEEGAVLGTVGYMSPEQASGQPVDFRSDQFALGAILYEMASGKRAFEQPTGRAVWVDQGPRAGSGRPARSLLRDVGVDRDRSGRASLPAVSRLVCGRRSGRDRRGGPVVLVRPEAPVAPGSRGSTAGPHGRDLSAGLPDRRALRSRRTDDRLLRGLGRQAQRDLHDANRQRGCALARNLPGGNTGGLLRWRWPFRWAARTCGNRASGLWPGRRSRAGRHGSSWRA
jgi:serine/threonine protein kinase